MSVTPDQVVRLIPRGVGKFATEDLRGVLRVKYYVGQTVPALGMVLLADTDFTSSNHVYEATMKPRATADTPSPADVFTDRACSLLLLDFDSSPVVIVEWQPTDFAVTGRYRLQLKATKNGTGEVFPFPEVEVEVVEAA